MKREEIKRRPMPDTVIESLEPGTTMYRERHGDGVYLRVKPSGTKDWQLRYKTPEGKWGWLGIGGYGKGTHQLTGQQAREKARQWLKQSKDEGIPLPQAKSPPALEDAEPRETFAQLAAEWLKVKKDAKSWTGDTYDRAKAMIENHVLPSMGARDYTAIPASEWFALFKRMEEKGILETIAKARAYCRDIYALAQVTDRAKFNPIDNLHKFIAPSRNENFAHVSPAEIPGLIRAMRAHPSRSLSIGLQLLALLAVRPSELREAPWDEFDLEAGLWTVAASRKKERREFVFPLPDQAVKLLRELKQYAGKSPLLFPGRASMDTPISNMTFNQALARMGYKGRQTPHGMRHLFSTAANEAGKEWRIVDSALAHKVRGTEGVYNKAQYLAQRRELMQWWADRLDAMAADLAGVRAA